MLRKPARYLLNIGLLSSFLGLLVAPVMGPRLLFRGAAQVLSSGMVLGTRLGEEFQNYLVYSGSQVLTGRQEQLTAYTFPGQVTVYHQVYEIRNDSSYERHYHLHWEAAPGCSAQSTFYFGKDKALRSLQLQPEETAAVSLLLEDSIKDRSLSGGAAPSPCDLTLTIEVF